jgi:UDP-N-acetyl-D-mannosaminuronate dehydrogenase
MINLINELLRIAQETGIPFRDLLDAALIAWIIMHR